MRKNEGNPAVTPSSGNVFADLGLAEPEERQTKVRLALAMRARKQGRVGGRPKLVLDRDQVRRLRNEGKSLREISDTMGLSLTTTARILKTA